MAVYIYIYGKYIYTYLYMHKSNYTQIILFYMHKSICLQIILYYIHITLHAQIYMSTDNTNSCLHIILFYIKLINLQITCLTQVYASLQWQTHTGEYIFRPTGYTLLHTWAYLCTDNRLFYNHRPINFFHVHFLCPKCHSKMKSAV